MAHSGQDARPTGADAARSGAAHAVAHPTATFTLLMLVLMLLALAVGVLGRAGLSPVPLLSPAHLPVASGRVLVPAALAVASVTHLSSTGAGSAAVTPGAKRAWASARQSPVLHLFDEARQMNKIDSLAVLRSVRCQGCGQRAGCPILELDRGASHPTH
jgi:hypothetical protein